MDGCLAVGIVLRRLTSRKRGAIRRFVTCPLYYVSLSDSGDGLVIRNTLTYGGEWPGEEVLGRTGEDDTS